MMDDKLIVTFRNLTNREEHDIEIPADITANELYRALCAAYDLQKGNDTLQEKEAYIKFENPIALLKGGQTVKEAGIRNGSVILFSETDRSSRER